MCIRHCWLVMLKFKEPIWSCIVLITTKTYLQPEYVHNLKCIEKIRISLHFLSIGSYLRYIFWRIFIDSLSTKKIKRCDTFWPKGSAKKTVSALVSANVKSSVLAKAAMSKLLYAQSVRGYSVSILFFSDHLIKSLQCSRFKQNACRTFSMQFFHRANPLEKKCLILYSYYFKK